MAVGSNWALGGLWCQSSFALDPEVDTSPGSALFRKVEVQWHGGLGPSPDGDPGPPGMFQPSCG